jgi:hypothetical protein
MDINALPPRLYTSDVLKLCRFSYATLRNKQAEEGFPEHIDRGKEYIWDRDSVLSFLGLIENHKGIVHNDPFKKGLEKLGTIKG